jgi:hypothetical protein
MWRDQSLFILEKADMILYQQWQMRGTASRGNLAVSGVLVCQDAWCAWVCMGVLDSVFKHTWVCLCVLGHAQVYFGVLQCVQIWVCLVLPDRLDGVFFSIQRNNKSAWLSRDPVFARITGLSRKLLKI